jgi:hypothetical protein
MLISIDPSLLLSLTPATHVRIEALLLKNANATTTTVPYYQLINPTHVLEATVTVLGENFMTSHYKRFVDWMIDEAPYTPEFISTIKKSPVLMHKVLSRYIARASHPHSLISNPFAECLPEMDMELAAALSDEEAFHLIAAVVKGADWHGLGPIEIANGTFASVPALKTKAVSFAAAEPDAAAAIIASFDLHIGLSEFVSSYF